MDPPPTKVKKVRLPPVVLRDSYPQTSLHPAELRVECTAAELASAVALVGATSVDLGAWKRQKSSITRALRDHPYYYVVVGGIGGVRRSAEAGVRRIEDVLRWHAHLEAERGPQAAQARLAQLVEFGRARRAMRDPFKH